MKSNLLGVLFFLFLSASLVLFVGDLNPLAAQIGWALTAAAGLGWIWVQRLALRSFLFRRSTLHGANVAFVLALVLGILASLNYIAKEFPWRTDLTRSGVNSLSPQTLKVLADLPKDVTAYYFSSMNEKERNEPLFRSYEYGSPRFRYEFVDVARRPTFTQSMKVDRQDTVVLAFGTDGPRVKIEGVNEEKITNGLIKLLRGREQVVYFTTGHGERALEGGQELGFDSAKAELEKTGYAVKELNLVSAGQIPADAAVVIVAGPDRAFFPKELELLAQWIQRGGRALLALDLNPAEDGLGKGSRQLAEWLKAFGLAVPGAMLVDPMSKVANVEPQVLLGFAASRDHVVTKDFPSAATAVNFLFPLTTYFAVTENPAYRVTELVRTSPQAWAESDWASLKSGRVAFQIDRDRKGPLGMAFSVELSGEKTEGTKPLRLAVFGSSAFAVNGMLDKVGNRDLFLNTVAWLADDEQFISIRPREGNESLKPFNNGLVNLVLLLTVFALPALLLVGGLVVWLRRSKL